MADNTGIDWADASWNPIVGCSVVSPACTNCYAMSQAARIVAMSEGAGRTSHYAGTTQPSKAGPVWTGVVNRAPERILTQPLRWTKPRRIFVNSTSDIFHDAVPDEWIDEIFAIMALSPQHTFMILTKRPERMRNYITGSHGVRAVRSFIRIQAKTINPAADHLRQWPFENLWLGVTAEDQQRADERIPELLDTPAAVRFVSVEPMLGPIDLTRINLGIKRTAGYGDRRIEWDALTGWERQYPAKAEPGCDPMRSRTSRSSQCARLDWVICGGESGPNARPMNPQWAKDLRDQCADAKTPYFFKQWGEWTDVDSASGAHATRADTKNARVHIFDDTHAACRVGVRRAGHLIDGREIREFPRAKAMTP